MIAVDWGLGGFGLGTKEKNITARFQAVGPTTRILKRRSEPKYSFFKREKESIKNIPT
jgi:hypothetical protein